MLRAQFYINMLPDRGHIAYIHHFDHNDETDGVHIGLYVILLEVHGWVGCVPLLLQDSKQVHPSVTRKIDNNGLWFAYQHITEHVMTQDADVKQWSTATTQWAGAEWKDRERPWIKFFGWPSPCEQTTSMEL